MNVKKTVWLGVFFISIICSIQAQDVTKSDENPFIGKWVLESDSNVTIVFTANTYYFYRGEYENKKSYTYDSKRITYSTEYDGSLWGNVQIVFYDYDNYSFVEGKLILGDENNKRIYIRTP
jgi:hypothetical protein